MTLSLNSKLNVDELAARLARERKLQVKEIFEPASAEKIHAMLANETPWWLVYNVGDKVEQLSPERLRTMHPAEIERILGEVVERAKREYQFVYAFYPVLGNYFSDDPKPPISAIFRFLNRPDVLDWFRRLTGRPDIRWVDAQATLYQSGHFLRTHSDQEDSGARVAAYVLNFTKQWQRDWGGYLQFYNDDHDIELALRPIFNALNIFLVPTDHAVGIVAPFADADRLSVTGWLRIDDPPGPIEM